MATNYVIVGGGLAAAGAVEGIRELDPEGPITMITAERELPYHRPPLSKGFLAGTEQLEAVRVHEASWYRDHRVRVRLGTTAKSVHIGRQGVTLESGERVSYDRLLLATGSAPRRLLLPGAESPGLCYLRTLHDAVELKRSLKPGVRLVVVGGGFIGMEVAASARRLGAEVTLLEMGPQLYRAFASPQLSGFFRRVLEGHGVKVRTDARVSRFVAQQGRLAGVGLEDGASVPADVAVLGVGADPNTGWLATSGFSIEKGGLIVNLRLETAGKHVWGAGDIARFPDPVTKQPRRLEHWDNALAQGKHAGRNMAGANAPYTHQSAYFSDLFDLTINVLGEPEQPDQVLTRGVTDEAAPRLTALYLRGGRLMGAVMVNLSSEDRTGEFNALQQHITAGTIPED